jgi:hypothetical protein
MNTRLLLCVGLLALSGCTTYTTPGAGLGLDNLAKADVDIAELMQAEPAASFPARIAIARIQASGYGARGANCYGYGEFCVVTARDIETDASYEKLGKLPEVAGLAPMSRLLLPQKLTSTKDLRQSAARLRADLLLVYSLDTRFNVENTDVGPLALISLGFLPTKKAKVAATASAVVFDVRTGFVYGVAESTSIEEQRGTFWSSDEAVENARKKAESDAFLKMVDEVAKVWDAIRATHAVRAGG